MSSLLSLRYNSIVNTIYFRVSEAIPSEPNPLPEEPEARVAIYTSFLGLVEPALSELSQALADYRENESGWLNLALSCQGEARGEVEQAFGTLINQTGAESLVAAGRDRGADLTRMVIDMKVKLRAAKMAAKAVHRASSSVVTPPGFGTPYTATGMGMGIGMGMIPPAAHFPPLPDTPIEPFDGETPSKWLPFWQLFTARVDKNPYAHDVQKMASLKSVLIGKASDLVAHLSITAENYEITKNILFGKYGKSEDAVRDLRKQFFALPFCQNSNEVRKFQEKMELILKQLQAHGKPITSEEFEDFLEPRLTRFYVEKIESARQMKLASGGPWNLEDFRQTLAHVLEKQDNVDKICGKAAHPKTPAALVDHVATHPKPQFKPFSSNFQAKFPPPTKNPTLTFAAPTRPKGTNFSSQINNKFMVPFTGANKIPLLSADKFGTSVKCPFCKSAHTAAECDVYTNAKTRLAQIMREGACVKCFDGGHRSRDCDKREQNCLHCSGAHHELLCLSHLFVPRQNKTSGGETAINGAALPANNIDGAYLMCVPITIVNPKNENKQMNIVAFLDSGSSESYVSEYVAKKLGLRGRKEVINLCKIFDERPSKLISERVQLQIKCVDGGSLSADALTASTIVKSLPTICYEQEKCVKMMRKPDLLIGIELFGKLQLAFKTQLGPGLSVFQSRVGEIICGRGMQADQSDTYTFTATALTSEADSPNKEESTYWISNQYEETETDQSLNSVVSHFFNNEACGLGSDHETDADDKKAVQKFLSTITFVSDPAESEYVGRYEVGLPWLDAHPPLPNNYGLALGRMKSVLRRLRERPSRLHEYNNIMQEQLCAGILERVERPWMKCGPLHYLAHQPVYKQDSLNTKCRICYDGSAHIKNQPSLNDCLLRGVVFAGQAEKQIASILLRFRSYKHILISDIEKAFLQVSLRPSDRDSARLLWPADPFHSDIPEVLRFRRVTFGVKASPFLLGATVTYHLNTIKSDVAKKLLDDIYVDNLLLPFNECSDIPDLVDEIRTLFWLGGFNVRQFSSDCWEEILKLPANLIDCRTSQKVLGIKWELKTDTIKFSLPAFDFSCPITKRRILATIASVYDPLGLISPIILPAKIIQASLWKIKSAWDETVPEEIAEQWKREMNKWKGQEFELPRRYLSTIKSLISYELHCFADASEFGLGIVVYLRCMHNGIIEIALASAKALVVPNALRKKLTIPRLELHALTLGAKLVTFVKNSFKTEPTKIQLWTDSKTVVDWLKAGVNKLIFVENRLKKLREFHVAHVAGESNPADYASRGLSPDSLITSDWFSGPEWLATNESDWPVPIVTYAPVTNMSEPDMDGSIICAAAPESDPNRPIIDVARYSTLKTLKKHTVYLLRFIKFKILQRCFLPNAHFFINEIENKFKINGPITADELRVTELILIRDTQRCCPINHSTRINLGLYQDKYEIWRCKGRLERAKQLPENTKFPIFLPYAAPLTILIIHDLHLRLLHAGPNLMVSEFRREFWTPSLRKLIRNVVFTSPRTKCLKCFKFLAKAAIIPPEPPLPEGRVSIGNPFDQVGVDYFGPMRVRSKDGDNKVWGMIVACFKTRAVHLELVSDLTTQAFILALRRFMARRGRPSLILSDNASTFKLGSQAITKIFAEIYESGEVQNFASDSGIS